VKIKILKKKLVVEIGIAVAVVAVFSGVYLGVSSWAAKATQSKSTIEGQYNQQQSETNTLRSKINNADSSQKTYTEIVEKRGNAEFSIDNERVRTVLEDLIRQYRIAIEGKLEYAPEAAVTGQGVDNLESKFVMRKSALLKFTAISDLHVYAFLDALSHELPGMVDYRKITIARRGHIDNAALAQLSLGKEVPLVDASVEFDWYGVLPKETKEEGQQAGPANPAGAVP